MANEILKDEQLTDEQCVGTMRYRGHLSRRRQANEYYDGKGNQITHAAALDHASRQTTNPNSGY